MTVKRRNHGRNRKGRGHVGTLVVCDGCGCKPPKDKAIKRFQVRNIVDNSSMRDIRDASAYDVYTVPKMYMKMQYCVGCAVHRRVRKKLTTQSILKQLIVSMLALTNNIKIQVVRGRAREARKIREPPQRRRFTK